MNDRESKRTSRQLEEPALCDVNLIVLAERELAAFAEAVKELFGAEQSHLSAADWIAELESLNSPARLGVSDLRRITIAASASLAYRHQSRSPIQSKREASHL